MEDKKIMIVTGANSGIGKITAIELAKNGDKVIMVCRNKKRGEKALLEVKQESGNEDVYLMICDLSSIQSIKDFSTEFKKRFNQLDILVHNAGVMMRQRKITVDGFEMHFQVNYLGPFLLTQLLLDIINPNGRIITVSSMAHRVGRIHFEDINLEKKFSMIRAYSQSKLALILFTYELARRTKLKVNSLHPGIIISNLGIYSEKRLINYLTKQLKWMFTSPKKGAETTIYLATSPDVENTTGKYLYKKKSIKSAKLSYDKVLCQKLWDFTENLIQEFI